MESLAAVADVNCVRTIRQTALSLIQITAPAGELSSRANDRAITVLRQTSALLEEEATGNELWAHDVEESGR